MVNVAQLVRALDCGSKGRGFEPHLSPSLRNLVVCGQQDFFLSLPQAFPYRKRFYSCSRALPLRPSVFILAAKHLSLWLSVAPYGRLFLRGKVILKRVHPSA